MFFDVFLFSKAGGIYPFGLIYSRTATHGGGDRHTAKRKTAASYSWGLVYHELYDHATYRHSGSMR